MPSCDVQVATEARSGGGGPADILLPAAGCPLLARCWLPLERCWLLSLWLAMATRASPSVLALSRG